MSEDYSKNILRQEAWGDLVQFKKSIKVRIFLGKEKGAHHEGIVPQRNEKSSVFARAGR